MGGNLELNAASKATNRTLDAKERAAFEKKKLRILPAQNNNSVMIKKASN